MSINEANVVRWTDRLIRKAILLPKPRHEIRKALASLAPAPRAGRAAAERQICQHLADHGDILDLPGADRPYAEGRWEPGGYVWLLVPLPRRLVDLLAAYAAEDEDAEADTDREPDADLEPDVDLEPDIDDLAADALTGASR